MTAFKMISLPIEPDNYQFKLINCPICSYQCELININNIKCEDCGTRFSHLPILGDENDDYS
jgi:hypothetical protein